MLAEPSIKAKLNDLHATFLEPSAGEGAFLTEILDQKLNYVDQISHKNSWCDNAMWALMSIYAIELLTDNIIVARDLMMQIVQAHYQAFFDKKLTIRTNFFKSAKFVIKTNVVQGNSLTYLNNEGSPITFSDWNPADKNMVKREEYTYRSL
ncbi:methylase, partial [Lactobacillus helveticus]|uniref:methylase n=2 Tax=Lactobacillaceae TaxID=33958 RepID=UPI001564CF79